jgi:Protein of unknown function (DUF2442)
MRKLLVFEFVTLDGVMQAPGGKDEDRDGGFEHGGWTVPYWHDDIGRNFFELMKDVDALLLGRRTYVTHAEAFEPMPPGDPFGDMMNAPKKHVPAGVSADAGEREAGAAEGGARDVRAHVRDALSDRGRGPSLCPSAGDGVTQYPRIVTVEVTDRWITAVFSDGRQISLPLAWSWRLERAAPVQRAQWELVGDGEGVRWPGIDEDLSARGFFVGEPAPRPRARSS